MPFNDITRAVYKKYKQKLQLNTTQDRIVKRPGKAVRKIAVSFAVIVNITAYNSSGLVCNMYSVKQMHFHNLGTFGLQM